MRTTARETIFSRLDFRAKLALFVLLSVLAGLWSDPLAGAALLLVVVAACLLAGIPTAYLGLMLRVMAPFGLLMIATHGFLNKEHVARLLERGPETLTAWWVLPEGWPLVGGARFTREGALYGVGVFGRSLLFLLLVPLCVFTTRPEQLVLGLVRLRLPYRLVFVFSSALRFFPLIFEEIEAVMETQRLRGHPLEQMGAVRRVKVYAKIAVPVILGAMFKAQQIEVALQSRAFAGDARRTWREETRLGAAGWLVIAGSALALLAGVAAAWTTGFGRFGGG